MTEPKPTYKVTKPTDYRPDSRNANLGTERGTWMLEQSIREDGAARSIVVDADGVVVAGNKTLQAAIDAGLVEAVEVEVEGEQLVVVRRKDWRLGGDDGGAARRYAYRDNRSSEIGLNWDVEQILADVNEGFDLSGMWRQDELDALLAELNPPEPPADPDAQMDRAGELQEKWDTALGQVWEVGNHRIACGDCTDPAVMEAVMRGERAVVLFEDPPYGIGRDEGFEGFEGFGGFGPPIVRRQYQDDWDNERPDKRTFDLHLSIAKMALIFGGNFFADILPRSTHWIVWDKLTTMPTFGDCELIWTNCKRMSIKKVVFEYNGLIGKESERFHPTQKPVGLCIELLSHYSKLGDFIFDGFLGSGTTIVACEQLGRAGRGIEISPAYTAVCLERLSGMGLTPRLTE